MPIGIVHIALKRSSYRTEAFFFIVLKCRLLPTAAQADNRNDDNGYQRDAKGVSTSCVWIYLPAIAVIAVSSNTVRLCPPHDAHDDQDNNDEDDEHPDQPGTAIASLLVMMFVVVISGDGSLSNDDFLRCFHFCLPLSREGEASFLCR